MTKPITDKAEIALEYPDKLYVGTFESSSRFEAHLDATGIALILERPGVYDVHKSIHMHIHFGLFADSCARKSGIGPGIVEVAAEIACDLDILRLALGAQTPVALVAIARAECGNIDRRFAGCTGLVSFR